jgi:hypothetical protein
MSVLSSTLDKDAKVKEQHQHDQLDILDKSSMPVHSIKLGDHIQYPTSNI